MAEDLIVVQAVDRHLRGHLVSGGSRPYYINEETGYLHAFATAPALVAGCSVEDAEDFLRVPGYRKVAGPPAPKVKEAIVAPVSTPEPEPEPELNADPAPELDPPDLSILDLSVAKLRKALETGDFDDQLDALLSAEEAGKTRKGAVSAITEHMNRGA